MKTFLLVVCASARIASAEESSPDPATSPGFGLLERFDASSRVGLEAGYLRLDGYGSARVDFHGQFVGAHGIGGYVQVQAADLVGHKQYPYDDRHGGIGSPELGAFYVSRIHDLALVYRLGVVLPTTGPGYDPVDALVARPNDVIQHYGGVGSIRLGASALLRRGRTFYRVDAGIDASVYTTETNHDDYDALYFARLGLGIGWDLGHVAVMAELSALGGRIRREDNASSVIRRGADTDDGLYVAPAVTVRGRAPHIQPYVSVCAPYIVSWSVLVGTDVSFD